MREKTLVYGAVGFTVVAAALGLAYRAHTPADGPTSAVPITIAPVSAADQPTLSSTEIPIRLTSSDGTGLRLQALRANAVVEDPLALTELHLTFENPESRTLEGTFRITLPQGASLSRFAMKVNGVWQEGEVVEKQAARRAYEDFLHRKQDPALMEQGAGNEFSARVFPIPANGIKEIILSYSETIEAGSPYVLPLRGLPMLGALDIDVHAAGAVRAATGGKSDAAFSIHQQRFTPGQDFVVESKQLPRSAGLRAGEYALARVVPFAASRPEPVGSAVVLVDTSASRGLGLADQARLVKGVLAKLNADTPVVVGAFDQEVATLYEGKASGFGDKEVQAITTRGALGASDVEQALGWAAEQAKRTKAKRVVMVGDGVATAGETDAQKLKTKVESLREAGIERMDAIATGGIRDDAFLRTVVRGVLDRDGVVLDAKLGADGLARRLGEATSSGVPVKVEGARWSWPQTLDGLQAGDEIMVYAQVDADQPVKITVGTQQLVPDLRSSDRPLVERAWAQAKIQSLVDAPTEGAAATKAQIVALSTQHRVLSPHTAMLVLENDSDYRRFGLDRNAKVDILTVRDGRIALDHEPRDGQQRQTSTESDRDGLRKGGPVLRPRGATAAAPAPVPTPMATATALGAAASAAPFASPSDPGGPSGDERAKSEEGAPLDLASGSGNAEGQALPRTAAPAPVAIGGAPAETEQREAPRAASPPPPPPPPARASAPARGVRPRADVAAVETRPDAPGGQVRNGALVVQDGLAQGEVQRVLRGAQPQLRACYTNQLGSDARASGHTDVAVVVDGTGAVKSAVATGGRLPRALEKCVTARLSSLHFPAPASGEARFTAGFDFIPSSDDGVADTNMPEASPYDGRFAVVMGYLGRGDKDGALDEARRWQTEQPGDIMALVALGEAYEARGEIDTAARAYGSILELYSFRADSRRFAGERLERLKSPSALRLAADSYGKAALQRPDHPASHRLHAFTLLKAGEHEKAFEAMKVGATRSYPSGRFLGADRILKEDLGLIASAWAAAAPTRRSEIMSKLHAAGGIEENGPSLRFVLVWETDANDVDFHIHDARGGHAYYGSPHLPSGGDLYADVTTGYGPECFTIRGAVAQRAYPYTLQAHYYARGPMGYGMGKLEVVEHDGKGHLSYDERPFVVMKDHAFVDLGTVDRKTTGGAVTASLK